MNLMCATLLVAFFQVTHGQTPPELQQIIDVSQQAALIMPQGPSGMSAIFENIHDKTIAAKAASSSTGIHEQLAAMAKESGRFDPETRGIFNKLSNDLKQDQAIVTDANVDKELSIPKLLKQMASTMPQILNALTPPAAGAQMADNANAPRS